MEKSPESSNTPARGPAGGGTARRPLVVHPHLFGIYPILFLFSHNVQELAVEDVLLPLGASLACSLISLRLLALLFHCEVTGGAVLSAFWVLFYGFHSYHLAVSTVGCGPLASLIVWLAFLASTVFVLLKIRAHLQRALPILNFLAIVFLLIPTVQLIAQAGKNQLFLRNEAEVTRERPMIPGKSAARPDVYYLVVDGYGRADVLRRTYGFDNREFLDYLRRKGFYVGERSHSNYGFTEPSLASSTNGTFLGSSGSGSAVTHPSTIPLGRMLKKSRLFDTLRDLGYQLVAFASGRQPTSVRSADVFMEPSSYLSVFTEILLVQTPIPLIRGFFPALEMTPYDRHRELIDYALEHIPDFSRGEYPNIVFAHLIIPHPPFVFDEEGKPLTPELPFQYSDPHLLVTGQIEREEYRRKYVGAVKYLNRRLMVVIDRILEESAVPPIIVLQGDHGPASLVKGSGVTYLRTPEFLAERFAILSAYRLPGTAAEHLYPEITPVNSFRLILSQYFDQELPFLPDKSFFNTYPNYYEFIDVTEDLPR